MHDKLPAQVSATTAIDTSASESPFMKTVESI
jgi:hypothetical protein